MNHTNYAGALRAQLRAALGADARQRAEATRPDSRPFGGAEPAALGAICGYRYIKRGSGAALALGLPGELADAMDAEWFMDLDMSVQIQAGDHLTFKNGDLRRVSKVQPSGGFSGRDAYRLYRLEVI